MIQKRTKWLINGVMHSFHSMLRRGQPYWIWNQGYQRSPWLSDLKFLKGEFWCWSQLQTQKIRLQRHNGKRHKQAKFLTSITKQFPIFGFSSMKTEFCFHNACQDAMKNLNRVEKAWSRTRLRVPSGAARWHWMYELKTWMAGWTKQPRGKCSSSWTSVNQDSSSLS